MACVGYPITGKEIEQDCELAQHLAADVKRGLRAAAQMAADFWDGNTQGSLADSHTL